MNKTPLAAATALGMIVAAPVWAADWYVSGGLGLSNPSSTVFNDGTNGAGNPKVDINNAGRLNAAVGVAVTPALRFELEYSRATYGTDDSLQSGSGARAVDRFATDAEIKTQSLMLNAIYQFDTQSGLRPFVRAGVGRNRYDMEGGLYVSSAGGNTFGGFLPATFDYSGSGSNFAWQLGLGAAFAVSDTTDLTLEYRYSDFGSVATGYDANGDRLQTDLKASELFVGVRFTFN